MRPCKQGTYGVTPEFLLNLLFYIIITPVISLTLTRMMYMSESKMVVADALARIDSVLEAAPMQVQAVPQHPQDASVALQNVRFSYDGKNEVIKGVSLEIQPGRTVAKHAKGEMRKIFDWDSNKYHGEIPEAAETYNVIGNINEWQGFESCDFERERASLLLWVLRLEKWFFPRKCVVFV